MDDTKLKSFLTVVNTGSINKAADILGLAPVSIKRQLDTIEAEINSTLLIRTSHGTVLTESGKYYFDFAQDTLDQFAQLKKNISRLSSRSSQEIILCSGADYSSISLETLSTSFTKKHPNASVLLLPSDTNTWVDNILTGKADCAATTKKYFESLETDKLVYHPTHTTNYVAVMNPRHPLSGEKSLTLDRLSQEKLYFNHHVLNSFFQMTQQHGIWTENFSTSPSSALVFNICANSSIYITMGQLHTQYHSLTSIPIDRPLIECGLITKRNPSKTLQTFIDHAQQFAHDNLQT